MEATESKPGLRELTADMVSTRAGETFRFRRPAGQEQLSAGVVELKLVNVTSQALPPSAESAPFRTPFSLLFELDDDLPPLGAGLHRLEHSDFASEDWHVVRVHVPERDSRKKYYESVFA